MPEIIAVLAFIGGIAVSNIWRILRKDPMDRIASALEELAERMPNFGRPTDDPRNARFDFHKER